MLLFLLYKLVHLFPYYLGLSALTSIVLLYLIWKPLNWTKDMTSVGYDDPKTCTPPSRRASMMRNRKSGRVPAAFPNGWYLLMESADLPVGCVKHVSALGENFAVYRSEEGSSYVLDAYCPHNGANMGIGGKVVGDCLQCPFHSWMFSGQDGKCTQIPYAKKVPPFARVRKWESREVNNFIFIWYHVENETPSWLIDSIPQIQSEEMVFHGRNEFLISCHLQEVPENGGDLSHFNAIHTKAVMSGSDLRKQDWSLFGWLRHEWQASWEAGSSPGSRHVGFASLTSYLVLFDRFRFQSCRVTIRQIGPGYVELVLNTMFGPVVLLQTVTPLEPLLQRVVHRIFCPPPLVFFARILLVAESIMIERDIMVWNHKKYVENPVLVSEEQSLLKHRRWFSQFYSENSNRYINRDSLNDW